MCIAMGQAFEPSIDEAEAPAYISLTASCRLAHNKSLHDIKGSGSISEVAQILMTSRKLFLEGQLHHDNTNGGMITLKNNKKKHLYIIFSIQICAKVIDIYRLLYISENSYNT